MYTNARGRRSLARPISLLALIMALPAGAWAQTTSTPNSANGGDAPAQQSAAPAQTQTPAPTTGKQTSADTTTSGGTTVVTVTAQKPILDHKIDRDVYDVKQDPQAATGAASDVLNNVPGVTVDNDGTVSLRGNSNAQVYVNGKKSAQMQGDNRATTLQSLSANDIDSIEVIPNPGAAFGADTAGGIINIVMKRGKTLKPQTSVNLTVGDQGRAGVGIRTNQTFGKWKINGGLNLNHGNGSNGRGGGGGPPGGSSPKVASLSDRETLDPTTGLVTRDDQSNSVSKSDNRTISGNLSAEYDFSDFDDLTADLNYSNQHSTSNGTNETLSYDGNHNLIGDVARVSTSSSPTESGDFRLTYDHRGQVGSTEDFKMALSHSSTLSEGETVTRNISHYPNIADTYTTQSRKSHNVIDEFSGDWSHPLGDYDKTQQQLQLGWSVQHTTSDNYNYQSMAEASPVAPPADPLTSAVRQFNDDQVLSAAYATYQRQWGRLGFQAGLRVEDLHEKFDAFNPTVSGSDTVLSRDTMEYSPSLFVTYKVNDQDQAKFIYSRKIQRPTGQQLDPQIVFSTDGLTATSGNASLKASQTDKYDVDYYHDGKLFDAGGSLYYNSTTGDIEQVSSFLASQPDVLLTTYQNTGTTRNAGFSGNFSFHTADRKLNLMFNPNYGYTVTDYIDPTTHLPARAKGPNSSANLRSFYKVTTTDNLMVGLLYRGKTVRVQGYTTAQTSLNLGWMHQIIPNKLMLFANASNILLTKPSETYTLTSTERGFSRRYDQGATFMMNLRYTFGQPVEHKWDGPPPGGRFDHGGPGGEGGPGPGGGGGPGGPM